MTASTVPLQQPAEAPPLQVCSREELLQLDTNRIVQLEPGSTHNPPIWLGMEGNSSICNRQLHFLGCIKKFACWFGSLQNPYTTQKSPQSNRSGFLITPSWGQHVFLRRSLLLGAQIGDLPYLKRAANGLTISTPLVLYWQQKVKQDPKELFTWPLVMVKCDNVCLDPFKKIFIKFNYGKQTAWLFSNFFYSIRQDGRTTPRASLGKDGSSWVMLDLQRWRTF